MAANATEFNLIGDFAIHQYSIWGPKELYFSINGAAEDLSSYDEGLIQIREDYDSATVIAEISTTNGRMVISSGKITIELPYAVTSILVPGMYVYDLFLRNSSLSPVEPEKRLYGNIEVKPSSSRWTS